MIIVLINNRFGKNAVGGAEKAVEREAEQLRKQGHRVWILASDSFRGLASLTVHQHAEDELDAVHLFPLNVVSFDSLGALPIIIRLVWHIGNLFNIHSAWAIRHWLKHIQPDQVHTHNMMGIGFLTPRAIRNGAPHAQWTHILHDIQLLHPSGLLIWGQEKSWSFTGWPARTYRAITRWLIGSPDEVISPSRWLLEEHRRFGFFQKSKCMVRTVILDHDRESRNDRGLQLRPGMTKHLNVLFLGQIEQHKGIEFLLQSCQNYPLPTTNYQLHIVGIGSQFERLKLQYPHHHWYGRLDGEVLESVWKQIDAVIIPSLCYENAPTVIVEAIAHGIPVIASRIGGIPEFVDDGVSGWLFTPGDSNDLLRVIQQMVKAKDPDCSVGGGAPGISNPM